MIVITTAEHLHVLQKRLHTFTLGIASYRREDAYIAVEVHEALGKFMINGWPDDELFRELVMGLVRRASARDRRVRAFGEMVALLLAQGNTAATVHLEYLWNRVCKRTTAFLRLSEGRIFSGSVSYPRRDLRSTLANHLSEVLKTPPVFFCHSHRSAFPASSSSERFPYSFRAVFSVE